MDTKDQSHMHACSGVTMQNKKINLQPHTAFPQKNRKEINTQLFFGRKKSFSTSVSKRSCCRQQIQNANSSQRSKLLPKSNSLKQFFWRINLRNPRLHSYQEHQKQVKRKNLCKTHFPLALFKKNESRTNKWTNRNPKKPTLVQL
jgi:hypothetical protein